MTLHRKALRRKTSADALTLCQLVGPTTTTQLQRLSVAFALQLRPGPTCRDVICTQDVRKVKLTLSFIALFAVLRQIIFKPRAQIEWQK